MKKTTLEIQDLMEKELKRKPVTSVPPEDMLSLGSALLNLAMTGKVDQGIGKGLYYFFVGDSRSGKTFLMLTCFAEACRNENFKEYRLIYDDVENGALMDLAYFFGESVAERLEPPAVDADGEDAFSETIEDFYYNLDDACNKEIPFIYILDSMDSLSSEAEQAKFQDQKEAARKGKTTAGSYGDGKAKKNSANLRQALAKVKKNKSILIIISQTRDNIGFGAQFNPKTRSGGNALTFYATQEIWTSIKGKIKKSIKGKARTLGTLCKVVIKKNRVNGKNREVEIPILYEIGVDDVGSMVTYLIDESHWTKKGASVVAPEFDFKGKETTLIKHIEKEGLERKLSKIVQKVWDSVEDSCCQDRKRRYE